MAAPASKLRQFCLTTFASNNYFKCLFLKELPAYSLTQKRKYSDENHVSLTDRSEWITLSDDGRTIICWHPEQEIPYECTKPLPIMESKLNEEDSVLKVQYRLDDLNRYNPTGPSDRELMKMTFTTKHRWFPNNNIRYRKPNPPVDREGL